MAVAVVVAGRVQLWAQAEMTQLGATWPVAPFLCPYPFRLKIVLIRAMLFP